jgi:Fe-S-cluster-containing hydrogenase component 2
MRCIKACPTAAITGKRKEPHVIDETKCVTCRACFDVCTFGAVEDIGVDVVTVHKG